MFAKIVTGLRALNWLNWIAAVLVSVIFAVLIVNPGGFLDKLLPENAGGIRAGEAFNYYMIVVLALLLPIAVAVHYILTRLAALVGDAAKGAAFTEINALRLRSIGWALLFINLADLVFGWASIRISEVSGEYFGWSLSLTGWIAVPMLFVLAAVFRQGAAMRDDLEGTV